MREDLLHEGIRLFNNREFFACHEVLEEAWTPETGPHRLFLQSLIHVAVALYHHQRGNPRGAIRQLHKALRKLAPYLPACQAVDTARLYRDAAAVLRQIESGAASIPYPLIHASPAGHRFAEAAGGKLL